MGGWVSAFADVLPAALGLALFFVVVIVGTIIREELSR